MRQLIIAVVVFEIQQCQYRAIKNIKLAIKMNTLIVIIMIMFLFIDLTIDVSTRSWLQNLVTLSPWQFGTLYCAHLQTHHSWIDRGDALRRRLIHIIMRYWLFDRKNRFIPFYHHIAQGFVDMSLFQGFNREWRHSIGIYNWELREGIISSVLPWFCQRIGFYSTKVMTSNKLQPALNHGEDETYSR